MSDNQKHNELPLVRRPSSAVEKAAPGAKRILSGMVEDTLAVAYADLDAGLREGKRLYCSMMKGRGLHAGELTLEDIQSFNFRLASGLSQQQEVREEDAQAFALFYRAAKAGHGEAQFIVSRCYDWGHGVQRDETQVQNWLQKSAESGFAEAQNALGDCYAYGDPQEQADIDIGDALDKAVKWYHKAAEQNHSAAQFSLGVCYENGLGVETDYTEAIKWYRKAAEQGHESAQENLNACYANHRSLIEVTDAELENWFQTGEKFIYGQGVPQDYIEAVRWYRKAAEHGHTKAQLRLGQCYKNGIGVVKDFTEAFILFRKCAEQGDAVAQFNLGGCYYFGEGVPKNYSEAHKWFQKAAEQGDADAQNSLGIWHYHGQDFGQGVAKNHVESYKWLKLASEQGHKKAKDHLAELTSLMKKNDLAKAELAYRDFISSKK